LVFQNLEREHFVIFQGLKNFQNYDRTPPYLYTDFQYLENLEKKDID